MAPLPLQCSPQCHLRRCHTHGANEGGDAAQLLTEGPTRRQLQRRHRRVLRCTATRQESRRHSLHLNDARSQTLQSCHQYTTLPQQPPSQTVESSSAPAEHRRQVDESRHGVESVMQKKYWCHSNLKNDSSSKKLQSPTMTLLLKRTSRTSRARTWSTSATTDAFLLARAPTHSLGRRGQGRPSLPLVISQVHAVPTCGSGDPYWCSAQLPRPSQGRCLSNGFVREAPAFHGSAKSTQQGADYCPRKTAAPRQH